jgi:hypothetical protein
MVKRDDGKADERDNLIQPSGACEKRSLRVRILRAESEVKGGVCDFILNVCLRLRVVLGRRAHCKLASRFCTERKCLLSHLQLLAKSASASNT